MSPEKTHGNLFGATALPVVMAVKRLALSPWIAQGALAAVAALGVALVSADDPVAAEVLAGASFGALIASGVGLIISAADDDHD